MRYSPKQRDVLISNPTLKGLNSRKGMDFDPYAYAQDLFYIDDWLTENFYSALDLSEPIHCMNRLEFAAVLLSVYLASPEYEEDDYSTNHWQCLERFLIHHGPDCMGSEDEDSLVSILAGL